MAAWASSQVLVHRRHDDDAILDPAGRPVGVVNLGAAHSCRRASH
ncbi:hypothetical protein [Labrys sp. ZIDIC5]|nr:hypothetical protein [Labrys sp. ZIDIC5]MDZ5451167.1 hypothetical protein [Labrys sp. ZIDIC5]